MFLSFITEIVRYNITLYHLDQIFKISIMFSIILLLSSFGAIINASGLYMIYIYILWIISKYNNNNNNNKI